ncbi:MAG: hypothetical protein H6553_05850 [Chitinophagales bacterium]|nr:hypothetical protein [Chitinophagales bacterium]
MTSVENLKNDLIDKILTINNKDFLEALNQLINTNTTEIIELSDAQKAMLEMSEQDIINDELISQEAMDKRNLEWLNAL